MNLNEAIKTLKTAGYLVESIEGYDDLCQYLNDSLREEKSELPGMIVTVSRLLTLMKD